jgi:tetratricopeptide (TPR) repeat protein
MMAELEIRMDLGIQLSALYGCGAPEVVEAFRHALALAKPLGDDPRLFPIYWGLWSSASSWANFDMTAELAETLLRLAHASDDPTLLAHAHYARGYSHFFFGNFDKCIAEYQKGVAAYDPDRAHLALGEDAMAVCLSALAIAYWYAGRYDDAQAASLASVAHARRIDHPYSLLTALAIKTELHRLCGDYEQVSAVSAEAIELARGLQAPLWYEVLACSEAWAEAARGNASVLADIALGVQQVNGIMRGLVPFFITRWVEACDLVGDVQTGLQVAARGLAAANESKDVHYLSEFERYKGKFLFAQGQPARVYLPWLERAVTTAQDCSSPPLILRAAMSLVRYGATASSPDLLALLERTLGRMQGGEAMWEVRAAQALLDASTMTSRRD